MIEYIAGDLFKLYPRNKNIAIAHCCNDIRKFGSGFALALGNNFCSAKTAYLGLSDENMKLGTCQLVRVATKVFVVNMIGQKGVIGPNNPMPIRYDALEEAMIKAQDKLPADFEIYSPMLGSGLAGGSWNEVEKLVKKCWIAEGRSVTICKLK